MTPKYAKEKLAEIKKLASTDFEGAHALEDSFVKEFVEYVASDSTSNRTGREGLRQLAKIVLKTYDIPFQRVCS